MEYEAVLGRSQRRFIEVQLAIDTRLRQNVARQMLAYQLIIGDIGVQGADEIIAVAPRVGNGRIALTAV